MSWMARLYETYEQGMKLNLDDSNKLMPICHTLQNAHIKITLDENGNFKQSQVLEKKQIVLPATENSASRSSGEAPHPLNDKIQYVAGDYLDFGGKKKGYFNGYLKILADWCESPYSHPKVQIVKKYIEKGSVVRDLIKNEILFVDDNENLLLSWAKENEGDTPLIFKVLPKEKGFLDQGNALVCWSVECPNDPITDTWTDKSIQDSWISYDLSSSNLSGLCYVTGKEVPLAVNHPAKLRHSGDKAKLISSNDLSGFTFKGRFTDSDKTIKKYGTQSVGIGFDVTQKAHNALRWLISRQSFRNDTQVILAWAISGSDIPEPMKDSYRMLMEDEWVKEDIYSNNHTHVDHTIDLGQSFSKELNKYLSGYKARLNETDNIIIMGLDSATPGRMAVTYYQEFFPQEYIDRLFLWHNDFAWFQRHHIEEVSGTTKPKVRTIWPISSPSPRSIWEAVYGINITDSLKKNTIERILNCIIESQPFPQDLVHKAVQRACNRTIKRLSDQYSNSKSEKSAWKRDLCVACALFKGHCKRNKNNIKEYKMTLETNNFSRDYLYGRLLAVAEKIEEMALYVAGEDRPTTAARLMQRFADRPASTWRNIELALQPYIQRLKNNRAGFLHNIQTLMDEIMNQFQEGDFINDKSLSGEFLLAYHTQRLELRNKTKTPIDNESE